MTSSVQWMDATGHLTETTTSWTVRQTDGQTIREMDGQMDGQTDGQTGRQTDPHIEMHGRIWKSLLPNPNPDTDPYSALIPMPTAISVIRPLWQGRIHHSISCIQVGRDSIPFWCVFAFRGGPTNGPTNRLMDQPTKSLLHATIIFFLSGFHILLPVSSSTLITTLMPIPMLLSITMLITRP